MKNRLCPDEELLSRYLGGVLPEKEKTLLEKHLAACRACRTTIAQAHHIAHRPVFKKLAEFCFNWIKKNLWLAASITSFGASFWFSQYFLQLLTASLLLGGKWIIDTKTTKTLIQIHKTLRSDTQNDFDEIFTSHEDLKNKRRKELK